MIRHTVAVHHPEDVAFVEARWMPEVDTEPLA